MKMKNKEADQITAKQKHKENLKHARRIEPDLTRPVAELNERPSILIFCEGKNTEPSYFNQFRLSFATLKSNGEGHNTISLVQRAKQISNEKNYDQIWCVFDKDDFNDNDFNRAIMMAEAENFGAAYSNQAFEYWLILHFDDHQGGRINRNRYNKRINELLNQFNLTYEGNGSKLVDESFFELLNGVDDKTNKKRVELAISRAERNYNSSRNKSPAKAESTTTVFRLVKELLKYV
jgi:RloB-like protein